MNSSITTHQVNDVTNEELLELVARVRPMMKEVDLSTDVRGALLSTYNISSTSGKTPDRWMMKLLVLQDRGDITDDEYREVGMYLVDNPDEIGGP